MKIDTTKQPKIPDSWTIEYHDISLGKIEPNFELYLTDKQKESYENGNNLRLKLKDKSVLNATVLDYLLNNPKLIPTDWKEKNVYFWGTIYRDSLVFLYVRYLFFNDGEWRWGYGWLGRGFDSHDPSAVLASSSLSLAPKSLAPKSLAPKSFELRLLALEDFKKKVEQIIKL